MPEISPGTTADPSRFQLFCATALGFEGLLCEELRELGVNPRPVIGGVELVGGFEVMELIHLQSRIAESMRLRLKPFMARDFATLVEGLSRLPWHAYLGNAESVHVSVSCQKSRLYHSDAVRERCLNVLEQRLKRKLLSVPKKAAQQALFIRIVEDRVQVSVDASGELLHRRGERRHVSVAPLRETLAAGLVRALGPVERVWDPFCGSGALLIEWLLAKAGQVPGACRSFAFENWPAYRARLAAWQERKHGAGERGQALARPAEVVAWGDDIEAHALKAARENLAHIGYQSAAELAGLDFEQMAECIPSGTAILSNPPYGVRLGSGVEDLYQRLDGLLERRLDLRPAVIITGYLRYRARSPHAWRVLFSTQVGGIPAEVLRLP